MKALAITILMTFSTVTSADDFFVRYLNVVADCTPKASAAQSMSLYHFCAAGALQTTLMGEPIDERPQYNHLIVKFQKRGTAWERYEDGFTTEDQLNETLSRIDRNE